MAWQPGITDQLLNYLRAGARGVLSLNGIVLALGSVYLIVRLAWFFIRYLERTIFSSPW